MDSYVNPMCTGITTLVEVLAYHLRLILRHVSHQHVVFFFTPFLELSAIPGHIPQNREMINFICTGQKSALDNRNHAFEVEEVRIVRQ